jgi:hypothetical protein
LRKHHAFEDAYAPQFIFKTKRAIFIGELLRL